MKPTTYLLKKAQESINSADAELLLAHALATSRENIIAHPERPIGPIAHLHFWSLVKKRKRGIPLAYLIGHKSFFGLDFFVNKHTLIPRPETELMVETAIDQIKQTDEDTLLIDVGTGSGCIPISITKTLERANIKTFAIDISRHALRVAKKNAKKHGVDITFIHGNLLEPLMQSAELLATGYELVITANLPYLTEEQFKGEESIQHEPTSALVAKKSGLALYEELLKQLQLLFTVYYLPITCFFEIDPSQSEHIRAYAQCLFPAASVAIRNDLRGQHRLAVITIPS